MKIDICQFEIRPCCIKDLEEMLVIQDEAFALLETTELLRRNTADMLLACLQPPHVAIGAWYEDELAAFSILYFPDDVENLFQCLDGVPDVGLTHANYKLCIVRSKFRGNSLQYELGKRLIEAASNLGVDVLCATVSPKNPHSIKNIVQMGFSYNKTLQKYGYERLLYYMML